MNSLLKIGLILLILTLLSSLPWLLIFLNAWWNKPDLPLAPPRHPALSATFEINGKPYRIQFTWTEENYQQWNAGQGWNTRWKSSHRTCVKILNDQYAVVI
ncbi:MAG: hypothetical protein JNJ77_12265 [Planctomycetia bacterium]|nr:hypothetical protein [Planctomycetia bacterium]